VFRRGFKTSCENVACQQRRHLGLLSSDPIKAHAIAERLGVLVRNVEDVPGLSENNKRILLREDADSWSAVTISAGGKNVIILNSSHAPTRLASDLVHEIAHILIGHKPARVDLTEDGSLMLSTYDRNQEDEANWMAGCLLLPRDALVLIRRRGWVLEDAARKYGVSMEMMRFRMNVTGIDQQFKRRAAY
jgi:Zn-dependent peptidase ImmA (M78 family)